ncbi:hypothetical protein COO60DRAFT_530502 [Scenedesmus sp. NREL 46B-D3]|nr:hypothetical protein COO60DRAFT_530502 [Scenedesmus sp. NREL 46B-D3]
MLKDSECAIVVDEFSQSAGLSGNVSSGVRPYGKLCGSKQFTYTASFGPFQACGKQKATNVASLTTGAPTTSARANATLNIDVRGCEVYTPIAGSDPVVTEAPAAEVTANATSNMRLGAPPKSSKQQPRKPFGNKGSLAAGKGGAVTNCVSSAAFWKNCMLSGNLAGRCAVVLKLPTGPHTAFFPSPQSRVVRTYKAIMKKGTSSGVKSTDQWFKAAQAVAATQLNELAGVALPSDVRNALSLAGAAISVSATVPPVLTSELHGVSNAVALLDRFSTGKAGVKQC